MTIFFIVFGAFFVLSLLSLLLSPSQESQNQPRRNWWWT